MPRGSGTKSRFSKDYARFLKQLRAARKEAGLTQAETARRLRRPQSFIAKCESGERRVDVVELAAFCGVYRLDIKKFVKALQRIRGQANRE
jgi:transcriptional regulator with XRE-family HTH domain